MIHSVHFTFNRVGKLCISLGSAIALIVATALPSATASASRLPLKQFLPVGMVTHQSTMVLPAALQPIATGKRIQYVSTASNGQKIIVSGAIITPKDQPNQPKTVAWAHGTTGLDDHCAPSSNIDVFWPEAVDAVSSYIQQGWTVAATDYPGLGTPDAHPYLVGESEARAVIDSVRAARNLDSKLTNKWVVSGHSQGGQAALFAGEIADTYGNGLNLRGVNAIAPVSNADLLAQAIPGTPGQGYLVMVLFGIAAIGASVNPDELLAQPAKDLLPILQSGCHDEILAAFAPLTAQELLIGGQLPQSVVDKIAHYASPAQQASTAPVLLVQGTADESVPAEITGLLHLQVCSYEVPAYLHLVEGANHSSSVSESTAFVASYLQDRFAGLPAPSSCE
jgi:pimeloyl-ACP methyl ester carboxylesterase